jgi:hypothetical protein
MPPCIWILGDQRADPADREFGSGDRTLTDQPLGGQGRRRIDHRRPRLLDLKQNRRHAVPDRLKLADRGAELRPRLQIVDRRIAYPVHDADSFGAERHDSGGHRVFNGA